MLTRYWSLSQQGHLQPRSKLKASQLSTQLWPIVMHNEESWFLELLDSAYFAAGSEIISRLTIRRTVFFLWCQSVSGGNFGGPEPLCVQRNGLFEHNSAVTSAFGNILDSSCNNRTGFLVDDPLFSAVDWKLKENGGQPARQIFRDSFNIFIYRPNGHRVIFLAWNAHLELQPPEIPLFGYGTEIK